MRLKFERRYEEGYDLPDSVYQKWLKITYPDSVDNGTLADVFSDIPPLSPVQITDDSHSTLLNPSEVEPLFNPQYLVPQHCFQVALLSQVPNNNL